jgi:hypothetical protein
MGVRSYVRGRKIQKLEKERDERQNALIVTSELEKLQESIKFADHLKDLDEMERLVILEERIKKLKAKGLK